MNEYIEGSEAVCQVKFRDVNRRLYDPSTVTIKTIDPNSNITTYTYPATVTRQSTGVYYALVPADVVGEWTYQGRSTGGNAVDEKQFRVIPSAFP